MLINTYYLFLLEGGIVMAEPIAFPSFFSNLEL